MRYPLRLAVLLCATLAAAVDAAPPEAIYPAPGQVKGTGTLPAQAKHVEYKGLQKSSVGPIYRDLGFTGVLSGKIVWTFGDTLWQLDAAADKYAFCSSDSVAVGDPKDITVVHDIGVDKDHYPTQWIPLTPAEEADGGLSHWAEGGTNVIEYAPGKGLVWFLKNDRRAGHDSIVGGGVATVRLDETGKPVATRTMEHMWGKGEPFWGDIGVTYNPLDRNVYCYGNGANSSVYVCRVNAEQATDVNVYEYWDNETRTWGKQRFGDGTSGTRPYSDKQAVWSWRAHGQSNPFWSNHYNCWMTVYASQWPSSDLLAMTADKLEGPWSAPVTLGPTLEPGAPADRMRYAVCPHPEYDPSGKTLYVTWTQDNQNHMAVIEWE